MFAIRCLQLFKLPEPEVILSLCAVGLTIGMDKFEFADAKEAAWDCGETGKPFEEEIIINNSKSNMKKVIGSSSISTIQFRIQSSNSKMQSN